MRLAALTPRRVTQHPWPHMFTIFGSSAVCVGSGAKGNGCHLQGNASKALIVATSRDSSRGGLTFRRARANCYEWLGVAWRRIASIADDITSAATPSAKCGASAV